MYCQVTPADRVSTPTGSSNPREPPRVSQVKSKRAWLLKLCLRFFVFFYCCDKQSEASWTKGLFLLTAQGVSMTSECEAAGHIASGVSRD